MFEESVKVPFIVSDPSLVAQGTVNSDLVSQYDFMPTLLDYVAVDNPMGEALPGRSFADVLRGSELKADSHIVVFDEYGPVRMIRNREWKYVHRFNDEPNELYDLRNDPSEQHNLAENVDYHTVECELHERLTEWFSRYVHPERDGANECVTGSGQLGLCRSDAEGRPAFSASRLDQYRRRTSTVGQ